MKTQKQILAQLLADLWENNQDLNFGEISEVTQAAGKAIEDKIYEIRKEKIRKAGAL